MDTGGDDQNVKLVVLGDTGVGKSSLVLRFVNNIFKPYSESTIGYGCCEGGRICRTVVVPARLYCQPLSFLSCLQCGVHEQDPDSRR